MSQENKPSGVLIYNPLAGTSDFAAVMDMVLNRWQDAGWDMSMKATEAAGHATKLAAQAAAEGKTLVLAAGGDGTIGETAAGLAGTPTIMGLLPAGTANSFARELNMPLPKGIGKDRMLTVSDALFTGKVQDTDIAFVLDNNGQEKKERHWILWAGIGADGHMIDKVEPRPKWAKKIGRASYALQGLAALSTFSNIWAKVEVDGQVVEGEFILVLISNCRRYAGGLVTLSDESYLDDGLLEIWLFGGKGLPSISRHALQALRGKHHQDPDVLFLRGHEVLVTTEPVTSVQMDGNPAGKTPLCCQIKPGALRLLVPNSAPEDLFQKPGGSLPQSGY